ncbi:MAG: hypothetical protein ACO3NK_19450 [Prochlorotrichaceae cyanobacterium]
MTRQLLCYSCLLTIAILMVAVGTTTPATASALSLTDSDRLPMLLEQDDHEGLPGGRVGGGTR